VADSSPSPRLFCHPLYHASCLASLPAGLPSHQDYPRLRVSATKADTSKALDAVRLRELKHGESSQAAAGPVATKPLKFGLNLNRAQLVTATAVHDRKAGDGQEGLGNNS
jgi:hypothetical protein